jgi:putative transposase
MYVQGVSTHKVSKIVDELCGHSVSSSQVSACGAKLDVEFKFWHEQPLGAYPYLIFDARYKKVRQGGLLADCAVLIAIGMDGKRSILGVSVALSEAEVHRREFFASPVTRGLCGTQFIVSDAHAGMAAARQAVFPCVPWQRAASSIFTCADLASAQARLYRLCSASRVPNGAPAKFTSR